MSTLDSFLGYVRPWAPGVPDPTAYKAIRGAAIEFCERTRMWKYESTLTVLSTDPTTSTITTPANSALFDIELALFDGRELTPKTARDVDALAPGWRTDELGTGLPEYITQISQNTMTIVPGPAADGSLYLCLRLKPNQTTTTLPDFLSDYAEYIGWGALGRLLTIPGQSYSSPDLGQFYAQKFTDKLDRLSLKGSTGQQNARKRTRASFY